MFWKHIFKKEHFSFASGRLLIQTGNIIPFVVAVWTYTSRQEKSMTPQITCLPLQANLISEDIESAISDSKGGKQKRRPEALR